METKYTIRGSCSYYVCRYCRTKFGRQHQEWCEIFDRIQPICQDCIYYIQSKSECRHPALNRKGGDLPYEKDQCPL